MPFVRSCYLCSLFSSPDPHHQSRPQGNLRFKMAVGLAEHPINEHHPAISKAMMALGTRSSDHFISDHVKCTCKQHWEGRGGKEKSGSGEWDGAVSVPLLSHTAQLIPTIKNTLYFEEILFPVKISGLLVLSYVRFSKLGTFTFAFCIAAL